MSDNQSEIGKRLRQARLRHGVHDTATSAADAMGIPEPTYLAHENGSRGFRRASAVRYAKFYGVRLEWLMTGRGNPTGDPVLELFGRIPEERREEALDYLRFLGSRKAS